MIPPNTIKRLERLEALAGGGHPTVHRLISDGQDSKLMIRALISTGAAAESDLFICRMIYDGIGSSKYCGKTAN